MKANHRLILASTSPYRKALLQRLCVSFVTSKPLIDEDKEKNSSWTPLEMAEKLAEMKARSLIGTKGSEARGFNSDDADGDLSIQAGDLILGGDQLVAFENRILGKPHTRDRSIDQLTAMSGKSHELITAICLVSAEGKIWKHTDRTILTMKKLSKAQIEKVVDLDQPFDCAGSYKFEKHGIALLESMRSEDPTAIEGLPLLALSRMLKTCGIETP